MPLNKIEPHMLTFEPALKTEVSLKRDKSVLLTEYDLSDSLKQQINGNAPILQTVGNRTISPTKTTFFDSIGKNLFNKETVTMGAYVQYTDGAIIPLGSFAYSDFQPVIPNTQFYKNNGDQYVVYDINKQYLSGGSGGFAVDVPSNGYYVIINTPITGINSLQFELGNQGTAYEPYKSKISSNHVEKEGRSYSVAKKGGDYSGFNQAINDVVTKDLAYNTTLTIYPGEYDEIINSLRGNKKVSLVGVNKRECILINKSGNYFYSPLQIAGENYIKNLSIIANNDNVETLPSPTAYAFHGDYNNAGVTVFEDVDFESYQNASVGIGTHQDQTYIFKNCSIYSDSAYDGGALYFHNAVASGITNQKLIFDNCRIISERGYALTMDDANIGSGDGLGNDMDVTFINCMVYSKELGLNCIRKNTAPIGVGTLVGTIKLNPMSYGNNIAELNA